MDLQEIKQTPVYALYDKATAFGRLQKMYDDTDLNYRMYNGDQWYGLKVEGVEKVQLNFIKPIVKYKTGIVLSNLFAVNFSSTNFENREFRKFGAKICDLLNKRAATIWENDYMDIKLRRVAKDAAINDEGVMYIYYDEEQGRPVNEVLNKNDIYFGDETNQELQQQPYILIKQRMPVVHVKALAEAAGVPKEKITYIMGDMDTLEEAGEDAKEEVNDMCTVITKFYKENGTVHFEQTTKYVEIQEDTDLGLTYYPVAHLIWEEKKGSARGEGEVRHLIPNQLETNKIMMRRAITVKQTAYPQRIANVEKIKNPRALDTVGGTIKVNGGMAVDDVSKIVSILNPAQMSTDVEKLQEELIQATRELAGAGDIATGQVNPESASGRAILAVQQASRQPLTEHLQFTKTFVEDLARIWLDMITVYNNTVDLEEVGTDPMTGEESVEIITVSQEQLRELQAAVKVDITPKGAFDKYAQEQSIENLLTAGYFSREKIGELKLYVKTLDDDSTMPKQVLEDLLEEYDEDQRRIAEMHSRAQMMMQRANQFLMGDVDMQASQLADAQTQTSMPAEEMPEEAELEEYEENIDDN